MKDIRLVLRALGLLLVALAALGTASALIVLAVQFMGATT